MSENKPRLVRTSNGPIEGWSRRESFRTRAGKVSDGRPDYSQGFAAPSSVVTARPITESDIPRNGRLVIVAPESVWTSPASANEPAFKGTDGRMHENRYYASRVRYGRMVKRSLESGGSFATDTTWAEVVASFNPKRKA